MNEDEKLEPLRDEFSWYRRSCIARVLRGKHCLVIGATGTGKTWWMTKVADRYLGRFIFVNSNEEEVVENICTTHYGDAAGVINGIRDKETRVEFVPNEDSKTALTQLEEIRKGLFRLATELEIPSGMWWLNFILDEAQTFAWKGSREDVEHFATRGRRYGIRSFFLTQRPQNISSTIINNAQNQIIFRTGPYETPYFKNYRIPIEDEGNWLKKKYHYILYDGFQVYRCYPSK
jgi:DNA helicase HerA-like ATPase